MNTRSDFTASNLGACTQAAFQATLHAGLALAALIASVASLFTGPGPRREAEARWPVPAGALRETAPMWPDAAALPSLARPEDTALRTKLLQRLALQPAWQTDTANVHVADGVAVFQGLFKRESERDECVAIALRMPGIRAVRDQRVRLREWQSLA